MKPFSFNAKPEEALPIHGSLTMTEFKSFNANLNSTGHSFNPLERSVPTSNQSQTIEFEAQLKADGINLH
ncbi:hypothetical protein [Microcoleus asticus]|uniref:Uncharacterized protein n=1 Tax=Microcoleus asticus IPMA8 TaxID=2563858 RepID=A0ABX2D442_9CYAN|nr:hypothetical protein [Microcoleus asticus]NQE36722.1 hypothetical protein [Microcoleus asticus IPMA8]